MKESRTAAGPAARSRPASGRRRPGPKRLNLALQGGGAHGAFTWGVLDRLLEDDRLAFDGLSGASAGAVNAVAMAAGLATGGRDGARRLLAEIWQEISHRSGIRQWLPRLPLKLPPPAISGAAAQLALDVLTRIFSPAELNPFDIDPLRDVLAQAVDFSQLAAEAPVRLFISATDVATGQPRIFDNGEITLETVLASACLPSLHRPVEIDGRHYWDGGFSANPPLRPLVYDCEASDTLLVQLDPAAEAELPTSAQAILGRLSRIALNQSLRHEIELIAEAQKSAATGSAIFDRGRRRLRNHRFHVIEAGPVTSRWSHSSRLVPDWDFLCFLRDEGRMAAEAWLGLHLDEVGHRSTADLMARLQGGS